MRTLLPDPPSAEWQELLERRRRLDQDRHDEVWEGVLHVAPYASGEHSAIEWQLAALLRPLAKRAGLEATGQFILGDSKEDYRVPDGGLHRAFPRGAWLPTAAFVLEILSTGDETWEKLPFYAAHHVDEVLILDPETHKIDWLALADGQYQPIERSLLIELGPVEVAKQIDWP